MAKIPINPTPEERKIINQKVANWLAKTPRYRVVEDGSYGFTVLDEHKKARLTKNFASRFAASAEIDLLNTEELKKINKNMNDYFNGTMDPISSLVFALLLSRAMNADEVASSPAAPRASAADGIEKEISELREEAQCLRTHADRLDEIADNLEDLTGIH